MLLILIVLPLDLIFLVFGILTTVHLKLKILMICLLWKSLLAILAGIQVRGGAPLKRKARGKMYENGVAQDPKGIYFQRVSSVSW